MTPSDIKGDIRFEGVGFTYPNGPQILHDIEFEAKPGQMVALVGLTGAGKTTLVSLIPRFYNATEGRVLIDGADVRHFRVRSLREQIAIVLQDPVLFSGTIADNLRYGNLDATPQAIEDAARAAHAHEFIARLPKGYDTEIAEAGGGLSGGERQRLSVARAILKNAPILILDEPTSSLDAISEEIVFAALRRLRAGRTTIVIAHRLSTVRDADRILVLDGGKIAAQGRHEELLKSSQLYRRMCARLSVGKSLDEPESVDELIEAATIAGGCDCGSDWKAANTGALTRPAMQDPVRGIIARYPFGGVTWCSLMYLLGLRALGHEVFYIEDTGECVYDPVQNTRAVDPSYGTNYIHAALAPYGLGDRWSFVNYDGSYHGRTADEVRRYARSADLFINLSGGSWFWRDEYAAHPAQDLRRLRSGVHAARHRQGGALVRGVLPALRSPVHVRCEHRHARVVDSGRRFHVAQDLAADHDRRLAHDVDPARSLHDRHDVADRELRRRRRQQGSGIPPRHRHAVADDAAVRARHQRPADTAARARLGHR